MHTRLYLLKIELLDIEPVIWRRFVVPADITLDRLHDVIQIVMGWKDSHLHEFSIGKKRYTENPESKEEGLEEGKYRLVDLCKKKGRTMSYWYDFGDDWQHTITLEDSNYFDPGLDFPMVCLEGEGACPPEDVGGVPGYYEFCKVMSDPDHKEHESFSEWYASPPCYHKVYYREKCDMDAINHDLFAYQRWSRTR